MNKPFEHSPSIYFYDFETWGANPKKDRPSQFAGIRTDYDLNIISEPLVIYSRIADDYLPHPEAALITGITPQKTLRDGIPECEFIAKIHAEFSQPDTCVTGYNSIRFDDEVTRYTLYRNLYDPYAREWQNGNSRWDIIDMVRACYALRPEGIQWPEREPGVPSFKLEELTVANGITHANAHDALSDVIATIEIAKLIKQKQPRLYDYLFKLRHKKAVAAQLDLYNMTPVVHISSKFPAANGCATWVSPLDYHPTNKNAVIVFDLQQDPQRLADLSAEEIHQKLYTKTEDLAPNESRIGLKLLHINKCPIVSPAKTLSPERAETLGICRETCLKHYEWLRQHPHIREKVAAVFAMESDFAPETNPDYGLYGGKFPTPGDKAKFDILHNTPVENLAGLELDFEDSRYNTLFFRYKARNYPNLLTESEMQRWQTQRTQRLQYGEDNPNLTAQGFIDTLEQLVEQHQDDEKKISILKALYNYAQNL